jgi:Transglutaminase elicitor
VKPACNTSRNYLNLAIDLRDYASVARLTLELNHEQEKLQLLMKHHSTSDAFKNLDSKYAQLASLLEQDLTLRPFNARNGDGRYLPGMVYDPREAQVVNQVTNKFGPLYIRDSGHNTDGSARWEEVSVNRPWSGYWYPLKDESLFKGENSPLSKLDKVSASKGVAIQSALIESKKLNLGQESWEGRCAAWAVASIMTPEPLSPRVVEGVTLSVSDQKALFMKAFELYPHDVYGVSYTGESQTDGTYQDIRPEAFHSIFLRQLAQEKMAFIIDDDPGVEIWSKPIYRVRWTIQPDPEKKSAYIVTAQPWMTRHRTEQSEIPTSINDRSSPEWTYRLYVNPNDQKDGKFRVIAGEWIGTSVNNHPDTITVLSRDGKPKSSNPEINKALELISSLYAPKP